MPKLTPADPFAPVRFSLPVGTCEQNKESENEQGCARAPKPHEATGASECGMPAPELGMSDDHGDFEGVVAPEAKPIQVSGVGGDSC